MRRVVIPFVVFAATLFGSVPAIAQPEADLSVTKADSLDPVKVGADLVYSVGVMNAGPDSANGVTLTDDLPDTASIGSVTTSQGTCAEAAAEVTCQLGTLDAGGHASVSILMAFTAPGALQNTATASGGPADPNAQNDADTESTTVTGATCTTVGTWDADSLTGTGAPNVLCGLGGHDILRGERGTDTLYGGSGEDTLAGGPADDHVNGETGEDTASFAKGPVVVRLASDTASGEGSDTLIGIEDVVGSPHDDRVYGAAGPNTLRGGGGVDLLLGLAGNDRLVGGPSGDYLAGDDGDDRLAGGDGIDTCYQGPGRGLRSSCFGFMHRDPNDTAGKLDIGQVVFHPSKKPSWRIQTRSGWSVFGIWDYGFFLVLLDTTGDEAPDYHAVVRSKQGSTLDATLFRDPTDQRVGALDVRKLNRRTIVLRAPLSLLTFGGDRRWYRWQVQTIWNTGGCEGGCFDLDPGPGGSVEIRP